MSSLPPTSSPDADVPATPPATVAAPLSSRHGERHGERSRRDHGERSFSAFLPLLLVVIAGVAWPAFQCFQLVNEKQALATVFSNQIRPFDDSTKLRNSLDAIARETALLASKGNPGAKLIVDELARRGVTINPSAPPPATDKK
jgi:hypothetical protein